MAEEAKPPLIIDIDAEFGDQVNKLCGDTLGSFIDAVGTVETEADADRVMFAVSQGLKMMALLAQYCGCPRTVWESVQQKAWVGAEKEIRESKN